MKQSSSHGYYRRRQGQQQQQQQRPQQQPSKKLTIVRKGRQPEPSEGETQKIMGTSNEVDKRFVRSTGVPTDTSNVRPPAVLEKALDFAVAEYERTHNYFDFMDRAKAIRQDMTIQGIQQQGSLSRRVYATNGRIALACKDFGEFNVCQNHLLATYGKDRDATCYEFLGLKVLYSALFSQGSPDVKFLAPEDFSNGTVRRAMRLCTLFVDNDYVGFFEAAATTAATVSTPQGVPAPGMAVFVGEMARLLRDRTLRRLLAVFISPLTRNFLIKALGFGADEAGFSAFAEHYKISFAPDGKVDNKGTLRAIASVPPPKVSILYSR